MSWVGKIRVSDLGPVTIPTKFPLSRDWVCVRRVLTPRQTDNRTRRFGVSLVHLYSLSLSSSLSHSLASFPLSCSLFSLRLRNAKARLPGVMFGVLGSWNTLYTYGALGRDEAATSFSLLCHGKHSDRDVYLSLGVRLDFDHLFHIVAINC